MRITILIAELISLAPLAVQGPVTVAALKVPLPLLLNPASSVDPIWILGLITTQLQWGFRHLAGTIGTGCFDRGMTDLRVPISDPSEEVYFYDNLAGYAFMVKITCHKPIEMVASD